MRPGTENDDLEETIQTVVLSDMKSGRSPPPQTGGTGKSPDDPEASLISDFQIITDIRVRFIACQVAVVSSTYMYSPRVMVRGLLQMPNSVDTMFLKG